MRCRWMTAQTKILLFIKYHLEYSFSIVGLWICGFVTGLTGRKTYEYLDRLLKISLHLSSCSAIPLWIVFVFVTQSRHINSRRHSNKHLRASKPLSKDILTSLKATCCQGIVEPWDLQFSMVETEPQSGETHSEHLYVFSAFQVSESCRRAHGNARFPPFPFGASVSKLPPNILSPFLLSCAGLVSSVSCALNVCSPGEMRAYSLSFHSFNKYMKEPGP